MDPEQALKNARKAVRDWHHADGDDADRLTDIGAQLVDAFQALDGWLSAGGFLPIAWSKVDQKLATR